MDSFGFILVASSDLEMRRSIAVVLTRLGVDSTCVSTLGQCREVLAKHSIRLLFCDRQFADGSYRDLMSSVASGSRKGKTRVVLTTNFISPGEYQEAKRIGVFDVIASPGNANAVEWMVILAQRDEMKRRDQALSGRPADISCFRAAVAVSAEI
jgi:DNA-binding NtrC family response regulator